MVFDTSVLVELIAGTKLGSMVYEALKEDLVKPVTSELNIAELRYILCRKVGRAKSTEIVTDLLSSGYLQVLPISGLIEDASRLKCEGPLSLVDCFTIALGEKLKLAVAFARRERELLAALSLKPFKVQVFFLEELLEER